MIQDPVRVKLDDGAETTVTRSYAEAKGLKVLKDKTAANKRGDAMPAKPNESVAKRAAKKTSAKKTAAKKTASPSQADNQEESS